MASWTSTVSRLAEAEQSRAKVRPLPPDYQPDPLVQERTEAWRCYAEHQDELHAIAVNLCHALDFVRPFPLSVDNLRVAKYLARALKHLTVGVEPVAVNGQHDRERADLIADTWG